MIKEFPYFSSRSKVRGLTEQDQLLEPGLSCEDGQQRVEDLHGHQAAFVHHQRPHPSELPGRPLPRVLCLGGLLGLLPVHVAEQHLWRREQREAELHL